MRHITQEGLALIKRFEGFEAKAYRCPAGYWTIGYGHMIRPDESLLEGEISVEQAALLLRADVEEAEVAVLRFIKVPLTDGQFDALVSFTFNLGAGALQRSALRKVVNRAEHGHVPHQLRRWVYAGGCKQTGLIRRREAEASRYMS